MVALRRVLFALSLPLGMGTLVACGAPDAGLSPEEEDNDPTTVLGASYEAAEGLPAVFEEGARVALGDVAVVVPARGETVGIQLHRADGTSSELVLRRDVDGTAHLVDLGELPTVDALPKKCADKAFSLEGFKWTATYGWSFRAASTPKGYDATAVEGALRRAANHITGSHNACGLADQVSATNAYDGRTSVSPNIVSSRTSVTCGKRDGHNVVAFGALPQPYLGLTCSWWDGNGVALEADVKLNAAYHAWFAGSAVPAGCSSRYSVEATMTHEFGHVFGLGHVSEAKHGELTMSTQLAPCTVGPARLGLGDVLGLRAKY